MRDRVYMPLAAVRTRAIQHHLGVEKALAFRIGSNTVVVYDGIGCGFKRLTGFQTIEDQFHGSLAAMREAPYAPTN